jgi:hypothetical protein
MPETSELATRGQVAAPPVYGVLAQFETTAALLHACERLRDEGYSRWDAHTPFPVHGLSRAMGLRPSRLPFLVLVMALSGGAGAMLLQWYVHVFDYPLVISGKPFFSWPAFIPITFEVTVLFGALAAVFGMLHLNRLPRHHHPLFRSKRFEQVTDDKFFVSVESDDPRYDARETTALLEELGASHVETVKA